LLAVADGGWGLAVLQWATLLAAAFFLLSASGWLAVRVYPQAYDRAHGAGNRGGMVRAGIIDAAARLRPAGTRIPLLLVKDLKTFLRDPMQWSQVLIFFGILALYIANLRRFNYDLSNPFYKNLISFLNLSATSLTLAMLITRFVYPMLSLEGEKFWILGLVPLRRSRLLLGKFLFAFGGSLLITEVLMVLSHLTLHTGGSADRLLLLNCYTGALLCFGLSGLGVGMGALFPVFGESNPSKIVAGFGGTLTMVLALLYVTITIMVLALPCHWHFVTHQVGHGWIAAGLIASVVLSLIAGALPMALGARAFERLEF
jgi:ABC-2 type transport system permease protein